jgi:hypothetical protein
MFLGQRGAQSVLVQNINNKSVRIKAFFLIDGNRGTEGCRSVEHAPDEQGGFI